MNLSLFVMVLVAGFAGGATMIVLKPIIGFGPTVFVCAIVGFLIGAIWPHNL